VTTTHVKPTYLSLTKGILLVAIFAGMSLYLSQTKLLTSFGMSPLVVAIVLGILYGNTLYSRMPSSWAGGIHFSARRFLRMAIILYGFRVSFQEIASIGAEGLMLDVLVVSLILILGTWIGIKIFKLDRHLAILISVGTAICGAAAVLAVEDILKSESYKTSVAVGTVVLFGTTAMFLYPFLYHASVLNFSHTQYGLFAGSSIHEVAQVLVAGSNVSAETGNLAVIVKMMRVLLLVPALFALSFYEKKAMAATAHHKHKITVPWFAVAFAGVIGFNSLHLLNPTIINGINHVDTFLLTMAMGAIGMETHWAKIRKVGVKPLYMAAVLFILVMGFAYLFIKFM